MNQYVIVNAQPFKSYNKDAVLLVRKDRPAWQCGYFNLCGGKIEEGELPQCTALRELREESGLGPYPNHQHNRLQAGFTLCDECTSGLPFLIPTLCGKIIGPTEVVYCYNVIVQEDMPIKPRPGETEKVAWFNWSMVRQDKRLVPSLRVLLPLMRAGIHGWIMEVNDSFMNKEYQTFKLTIPSEKHVEFNTYSVVDGFLENPQLALSRDWNNSWVYECDLEKGGYYDEKKKTAVKYSHWWHNVLSWLQRNNN